jgi:3-hydroxyisobutyrate dehydrogenase
MGSALARTLLAGGCRVTVWNRTQQRVREICADGAEPAATPADAVSASSMTLVSLPSYRATRQVLHVPEVERSLAGRTLVQLSTGSARQAREHSEWAAGHGGAYLDGSVMGYPRRLGRLGMMIIYAGSADAFERHAATLAILAPAQRHISRDPGGASTVSAALWSFYYGAYGAFLETAALATRAGASIGDFALLADAMVDVLRDGIEDTTERLESGRLEGDQATVDAIQRDLEGGKRVFLGCDVEPKFISALVEYLGEAQARGDGDKDVAVAFKHVASRADAS